MEEIQGLIFDIKKFAVHDGLMAIEKFIFDEESLTWEELNEALRNDFVGYEPLRQKILNRAPKYGNDDDEVDHILKEVAEHFCDTLCERVQNEPGPGGKTAPGFMTFGIHQRRFLPATPVGGARPSDGSTLPHAVGPGLGIFGGVCEARSGVAAARDRAHRTRILTERINPS